MEDCGLCGEPFNVEEGEEGYCPTCLRRVMEDEEEALRREWAEDMEVFQPGAPCP
jgi:hypothetical protein